MRRLVMPIRPKSPIKQRAAFKWNSVKGRENYLSALRKATSVSSTQERTLADTKTTLDAMRLQHKFLLAENVRLQRVANFLRKRGNVAEAKRLIVKIRKNEKEDIDAQKREKSIRDYYKRAFGGL